VVSDELIASPLISRPNVLIAMNKPSIDKFIDKVEPGGIIFINSSIIEEKVTRTDVTVYYIPALELATKIGNPKGLNVIMLGALVKATEIINEERALEGIVHFFSNKPELIDINKEMYQAGKESI
jgi:2-oxoglutarate ferredoxin oxidoreductase subunit gamma